MEDPAMTLEKRVSSAQPGAPKSSKVFAYCIIEERMPEIGGYHFEGVDQAGLDRYSRKNHTPNRTFNFAVVKTEVNGIGLEDALFNLVDRVTDEFNGIYDPMAPEKIKEFNLHKFELILRVKGYTVSYYPAPNGNVPCPVTTDGPLAPVVR